MIPPQMFHNPPPLVIYDTNELAHGTKLNAGIAHDKYVNGNGGTAWATLGEPGMETQYLLNILPHSNI